MTTKVCRESPSDRYGDHITLESWSYNNQEPCFVILNNIDTALLTKEQMVTFLQDCLKYLEAVQ